MLMPWHGTETTEQAEVPVQALIIIILGRIVLMALRLRPEIAVPTEEVAQQTEIPQDTGLQEEVQEVTNPLVEVFLEAAATVGLQEVVLEALEATGPRVGVPVAEVTEALEAAQGVQEALEATVVLEVPADHLGLGHLHLEEAVDDTRFQNKFSNKLKLEK